MFIVADLISLNNNSSYTTELISLECFLDDLVQSEKCIHTLHQTLSLMKYTFFTSVDEINVKIIIPKNWSTCKDPESFVSRGPTRTFFLADEGRGSKDPNTTKSGPSSTCQQNAI